MDEIHKSESALNVALQNNRRYWTKVSLKIHSACTNNLSSTYQTRADPGIEQDSSKANQRA